MSFATDWAAFDEECHESSGQQAADNGETERPKFEIRVCSSAELDATKFSVAYFVDYLLAKNQPSIIAAPQKALKTTIAADLLLSIASGERFLGEFSIASQARSLFMSGESGFAILQETARRICEAKGRRLAEIENLWWTEQLPQFGNATHIEETRRIIRDHGIELLTIDPCYLAMPGGDAGNLFIQGALLREMAFMCREEECSLLIIHHTKIVPKERQHEPLELSDIAWAGFQEFVRQWFLINRRTSYEPGSGNHELWLNVGSSVGHGGLWGVDVSEGVLGRESTRYWDVTVTKGAEARERLQEARQQEQLRRKKAEHKAKAAALRDDILNAFNHFPGHTATKTKVRERVGHSRAFDQAWMDGRVQFGRLGGVQSQGQQWPGIRRIQEDLSRQKKQLTRHPLHPFSPVAQRVQLLNIATPVAPPM